MRNTNDTYSHSLGGVTKVEIVGWPGAADNAVVIEDRRAGNITIEVDVAPGERWTYSQNNLPVLRAYSNFSPRAERRIVVIVPRGKARLVHFVKR